MPWQCLQSSEVAYESLETHTIRVRTPTDVRRISTSVLLTLLMLVSAVRRIEL